MGKDYEEGFAEGFIKAYEMFRKIPGRSARIAKSLEEDFDIEMKRTKKKSSKQRKLTKWQKFVKAKSKLPRFKYKTGKRKGMVNMKAVAAAWKKVPKSKK